MRKKIFAMAVVIICLSILATTTLAYFTDKETARNVITSGGISVRVVEQQMADGVMQPYPEEPIRIMPGATVSKIVSVSSLEQAAWIRLSYAVTVLSPDGEEMTVPADELAKLVIITPDGESWTQKDGWWYYDGALGNGETAEPIFDSVGFNGPDMGNEYQNCSILIDVTAQAVQKANNGDTALAAAGWPED